MTYVFCDVLFLVLATSLVEAGTSKEMLLPSKRYCGYQHSDDYFHSEDGTAINEFPWVAGLLYQTEEGSGTTLCSGCLITKRYVITSAHCVNNTKNYKLLAVRLGEYNIKNTTDCVDDSQFYECSDAPSDFGIEKSVVHPDFSSRRFANDIALLRLNRTVTYSDFIRPICLPTPGTKLASIGDFLTASGWGKFVSTERMVETKTKLLTKLITIQECAAANTLIRQYLTENHICTKEPEVNSETYCHVDSGSPVMFSVSHQWHLEGISSFRSICQPTPFPQVHIKVVNYLEWIENNIEP